MHDPCRFCERLQYAVCQYAVHVLFVVGDIIGSCLIPIKAQAYPGLVCHDHGVVPIEDGARDQEPEQVLPELIQAFRCPWLELRDIPFAGAYLPVCQAADQERHFVDGRIRGVHQ